MGKQRLCRSKNYRPSACTVTQGNNTNEQWPVFFQNFNILLTVDSFALIFNFKVMHLNIIYLHHGVFWCPLNFFAHSECFTHLTPNSRPAHSTGPLREPVTIFLSLKYVLSELLWHCCLVIPFLHHEIFSLSIFPGLFFSSSPSVFGALSGWFSLL